MRSFPFLASKRDLHFLVAYFAAVPLEEAQASGQLLAAKFFSNVFGDYAGNRVLPVFVALSAFGNLVSVAIGQARIFREVARQGK